MHDRLVLGAAHGDVVAVEGDVEVAERDRRVEELLDPFPQPGGDDGAAPVNAHDGDALAARLLDYLVSDPHERTADVLAIEYDFLVHCLSFLASLDRVKGTSAPI